MNEERLYSSDSLADRVIFLWVFMPLLRSELGTWVRNYNEHRIRQQPRRLNHVHGRPNKLYSTRQVPHYGYAPDAELLNSLLNAIEPYGK